MVEEYYTNPAISQSQLKLLLNPDPSIFNTVQEPNLYFEEKKYFIIGDGVDMQLTKPVEEFSQKFHVSNLQNKPSDTIKSIVNQVYDHVKEVYGGEILPISEYTEAILDSCNDHNYQPNWKTETRVSKVIEAWEYWEDLKAAEGKVVLSQEEDTLISQIVMSIRTSPNTGKYFNLQGRGIETLFQMPIYFIYEDINCKALLDMVIIDHNNKTIQPIDIKTMGDYTNNFPKALRQRGYAIQAAFYTEALKSLPQYEGYEILPFKFIVESTVKLGNPLVFTCTKDLLVIGKFGRESFKLKGISYTRLVDTYYGRVEEIKGFHQLIEDYKWYVKNGFEKSRKIVETNGELLLNWNGII